jgi:hypothetical protein
VRLDLEQGDRAIVTQSFRLLAIALFATALLIPAACGEEDESASNDAKTSESQPQSETSGTAEPYGKHPTL